MTRLEEELLAKCKAKVLTEQSHWVCQQVYQWLDDEIDHLELNERIRDAINVEFQQAKAVLVRTHGANKNTI